MALEIITDHARTEKMMQDRDDDLGFDGRLIQDVKKLILAGIGTGGGKKIRHVHSNTMLLRKLGREEPTRPRGIRSKIEKLPPTTRVSSNCSISDFKNCKVILEKLYGRFSTLV